LEEIEKLVEDDVGKQPEIQQKIKNRKPFQQEIREKNLRNKGIEINEGQINEVNEEDCNDLYCDEQI